MMDPDDWVDIFEVINEGRPLPDTRYLSRLGQVVVTAFAEGQGHRWPFAALHTERSIEELREALPCHLVYEVYADDQSISDIPLTAFPHLADALARSDSFLAVVLGGPQYESGAC
jgi:hypothetical protein